MKKLSRNDLLSLEAYSVERPDFRARVLAHKAHRRVAIGPNATLYFEDALTMQYQVQEMLRIERIFEADQIQEELDAYNPLIPDGSNLKATFMLEYPEAAERREALSRLLGVKRQSGSRWMGTSASGRLRTRTLNARRTTRPPLCTFYGLSYPLRISPALKAARRYILVSTTGSTLIRSRLALTFSKPWPPICRAK